MSQENVPYDLERFVLAQNGANTYAHALQELRRGRKTSHWMWFVFPQIAGLGQSSMARTYAIASLEEARAYLAHPILGKRLLECLDVLRALPETNAQTIFGGIDAIKLRSSLTLFLRAAPDQAIFQELLERYFGGVLDPATDERL
ncbi:DUF1810 domain-containing protein [Labilithrix luteola]|uniref:DUF1810 domain-containing protein n=1 Tax=Labilithrix luteola TaxID=1391654 RepID=UPI00196A0E7F